MKKCCVVANLKKPEAKRAYLDVIGYLASHGIEICYFPTDSQKPDFAVAIGGDGTVLNLAAKLAAIGSKAPILGINFGKKGALCQVQPEGMFEALDRAIAGKFAVVEHIRIAVEISRQGKIVYAGDALNDIVFIRTKGGAAQVDVIDNYSDLGLPAGDGVIVATMTGHTGYNQSAGGKKIHDQATLAITVISPVSPLNASTTTRSDHLIRIIPPLETDNTVALEIDGPRLCELEEGDVVFIKQSPRSNYFMRLDAKSGRRRPR